jgi:hypothetical protein
MPGSMLRVLYDGWPLAYEPSGPSAFHLLAILSALPEEVDALVALPAPSLYGLPSGVKPVSSPVDNTPLARLNWEQRSLPSIGQKAGVHILHLVSSYPPLTSRLPVVISPADSPVASFHPVPISQRLRAALAAGAAAGVKALLWPEDLDRPPAAAPCFSLPPIIPPLFTVPAAARADLPAEYILYPGPVDAVSLARLLDGWSWAVSAIGEVSPLILAGLSGPEQEMIHILALQADFGATLRTIPAVTLADWASIYWNASEVVYLGPPQPWGSPVLLAMAAGKPLVSIEEPSIAKRVGPAAYLVPRDDSRALGAAMTTLVVETEMAEALGQAAYRRAELWGSHTFGERLLEVYRKVLQ